MYLLFLTLFIFHRLERLTESHFEKVKEFMKCIKVLYASTLCVSSDKSPTCSQIIPILTKLEAHYSTSDDDNVFVAAIKEKVWGDLEKRYQVLSICRKYLCSQRMKANYSIFTRHLTMFSL